ELLFGRASVLLALLEGGLEGAILADQMVALLLCPVAFFLRFAQLALFLLLLGGQLCGFRRRRRLMAPGMIEAAADGAGFVLLQAFAQHRHAFAAHGATAFDDGGDADVVAVLFVELPAGALALFQQPRQAAFVVVSLFAQSSMRLGGVADLLPA